MSEVRTETDSLAQSRSPRQAMVRGKLSARWSTSILVKITVTGDDERLWC